MTTALAEACEDARTYFDLWHAAEAREARLLVWGAEVTDWLRDLGRVEENARIDRRRQRCPFCGTKARHDDDGAWLHDEDCVAATAHRLFMAAPPSVVDGAG